MKLPPYPRWWTYFAMRGYWDAMSEHDRRVAFWSDIVVGFTGAGAVLLLGWLMERTPGP